MVEMGSHPTKRFLFNHTTPFSTKGLEKSLCDFTGTFFVQCENPVRTSCVGASRASHSVRRGFRDAARTGDGEVSSLSPITSLERCAPPERNLILSGYRPVDL